MRIAPLALVAALLVVPPAHAEDDAFVREEVTFETSDGLTIHGTYWAPVDAPTGAPCVVALPMYRNVRASWEPLATPVTERGCALLAIDMRGHGESAVQGETDLSENVKARDAELFNAMHLDVEAAIAWARKTKKTPRGRVGLIGASVGCSIAIHAAVEKPLDVAAVAVLTPGEKYLGVPTLEHAERWYKTLPLHIFSSDEERKRGAESIQSALADRGAELSIVPGSKIHGTQMFGKVAGIEGRLAEWLTARITGPIPDGVIEESEIEGAVTIEFQKRDIWVRFVNGRLYVATRFESMGSVASDQARIRITTPDGKAHDVAEHAGMGMSRIDMDVTAHAPTSSAVTEHSYFLSELGVAGGAAIGIQIAFDDESFGPAEPIHITLE